MKGRKLLIAVLMLFNLTTPVFATEISQDNIAVKDTTGAWLDDGTFKDWQESIALNRWIKTDGFMYHTDAQGRKQYGWNIIDGGRYHFNNLGRADIGWLLDDNKWYYLKETGEMKVGWLFYPKDKNWYYLDSNGVMQHDTYINGCHLSEGGCWNDNYERRDYNGHIFHDYTDVLLNNGYNENNLNVDALTIKYDDKTLHLSRYSLLDKNGVDCSNQYVISQDAKVVRPM